MRFFILAFLLVESVFASPSQIIPSPVDHLYIPTGFDSNDSVEVVVTGNFPSPCYSRNMVKVSVEDEIIDIKVTAIAPDPSLLGSRPCPDMVVPFKEVVSVGNLQGGQYKVQVNEKSSFALTDNLKIMEASSSAVDDHVYAAVEWVENKGNGDFILHGWRYSNCFVLDEVKVVSNDKDTLSVLPVMKQVSDFCPMKGMPVSYPAKFNFSGLKMKKPLLHIRTMDGKSINSIIDLEGQR